MSPHHAVSTKELTSKAIFTLIEAIADASESYATFATSAAVVPSHFIKVVSTEIGGPVKGAIRVVSGFGVVLSRIVVFVVGVAWP